MLWFPHHTYAAVYALKAHLILRPCPKRAAVDQASELQVQSANLDVRAQVGHAHLGKNAQALFYSDSMWEIGKSGRKSIRQAERWGDRVLLRYPFECAGNVRLSSKKLPLTNSAFS